MTREEYKKYKEHINSTYNNEGKHVVRHFVKDGTMTNANNTSDRDADHNWPWIDYWRAMTEHYETTLHYSSCWKEIFTGDIPKAKQQEYESKGDKTSHKAEGGHIWVIGTDDVPGGRYITPLCPECNAKRGKQIPVKKDSVIFKELGAKVEDKN